MKSDIEKIIDARVTAAFGDSLPGPESRARSEVLKGLAIWWEPSGSGRSIVLCPTWDRDPWVLSRCWTGAVLKRHNRGMLLSDRIGNRAGKRSV